MASIGIDKSKLSDYKKTKKELLAHIKPSSNQVSKEKKIVDDIIKKIKKTTGSHVDALVAGSFARNTHLKDNMDFDIFVLYPVDVDKEQFVKEGLELGQKVFKGHFWEKAYSQHPYIRGIIDGYKIEVVPAYKIPNTNKLLSAVDRTPFHLEFLNKNLKNSQKDDIRLLKFFLKKIECYGADSEFMGFSGYLCELLILYYSDFISLLGAVANWQLPTKLSLFPDHDEFTSKFNDPLVVIDPTDFERNVASAVSKTQLSKFIAASRVFLENPNLDFFNKRPVRQMTYHQLVGRIENIPLVVLEFDVKDTLKDISWSKMRRLTKKAISHLEMQDFVVLKSNIYYDDENEKGYALFMLNTVNVPRLKLNMGPDVTNSMHSQNFVDNTRNSVFGPYIKEDKWYSIKQRQKTDVKSIVMEFAFNNFDLPTKVFVDKEIRDLYLKNTNITYYFSDFFINKEKFLI